MFHTVSSLHWLFLAWSHFFLYEIGIDGTAFVVVWQHVRMCLEVVNGDRQARGKILGKCFSQLWKRKMNCFILWFPLLCLYNVFLLNFLKSWVVERQTNLLLWNVPYYLTEIKNVRNVLMYVFKMVNFSLSTYSLYWLQIFIYYHLVCSVF